MARFEDTPGLFGFGGGASTSGGITCDWCKKEHEISDDERDSVGYLNFGNLQIAECCFEKVENAVLNEMSQILPWFVRILNARRHSTEKYESLVDEVKAALKK